jgi:hypothetical protein
VNKGESHKHWLTFLKRRGQKIDGQVYAVDQQDQTQVVVTHDPTDQPTQFPILETKQDMLEQRQRTISNRPNEK